MIRDPNIVHSCVVEDRNVCFKTCRGFVKDAIRPAWILKFFVVVRIAAFLHSIRWTEQNWCFLKAAEHAVRRHLPLQLITRNERLEGQHAVRDALGCELHNALELIWVPCAIRIPEINTII